MTGKDNGIKPPQETGSLLSVRNLTILTDHEILSDVQLVIGKGERVGLAGESGSGKSMLAWSILNLCPQGAKVQGEVSFDGDLLQKSVYPDAMTTLRGEKVSLVPQNPFTSLNPTIPCGEQLEEMLGRDEPKERYRSDVLTHLEAFGIEKPGRIYDSYPHELSGGQLQRVVIAMALIQKPLLVVADEPTTALDNVTQKKVLDQFFAWCGKNRTAVLLVSHDIQLLDKYCSRVLEIKDQRITHLSGNKEKGIESLQSPELQAKVILELRSLTKSYQSDKGSEVKALDDVNLVLRKSTSYGVVGLSGSGKTTLARIIVGLETMDRGELLYHGQALDWHFRTDARKRIQMIFQDPYSALYPHKSAGYCVAEMLRLHTRLGKKGVERRVSELFEAVRLHPDLIARNTRRLSGGQRRRVQIARALAAEPEILICDESFAGLDYTVQAELVNLFNVLREQLEMTCVFISHNLAITRQVANYLFVISQGQIIERGPMEEIIQFPQNKLTAQLVSSAP